MFKKTLAAVAVLGAFAGSAFAANVTMYGIIDTGLGYPSTDKGYGEDVNKFDMRSGQNSASRFGVKGEEDLGNGVKVGFSTKANTAVIRDNLVASINDPLALIKAVGVPYDWYATEKNQGENRWCAADGSKTEFDPCPRGWRVPVSGFGNASPWYNCLTAGAPWLNGVIWEDLGYWPAAGLLESSGQSYLGMFGYYWSATPGENLSPGISQEECAYGYNFDNQHSQTSYLQYRHTVLSVRCVKVQ